MHDAFRNSIPMSYRGPVCRIVISKRILYLERNRDLVGAKGGPWPNSIYRALESRRCLDFRALAASTGGDFRLLGRSQPPRGGCGEARMLEDAESRAAAFINYRTRAVRRWNALRRSSARCQMWTACPRRCTRARRLRAPLCHFLCPANSFGFTFLARIWDRFWKWRIIIVDNFVWKLRKEFGKYWSIWIKIGFA